MAQHFREMARSVAFRCGYRNNLRVFTGFSVKEVQEMAVNNHNKELQQVSSIDPHMNSGKVNGCVSNWSRQHHG